MHGSGQHDCSRRPVRDRSRPCPCAARVPKPRAHGHMADGADPGRMMMTRDANLLDAARDALTTVPLASRHGVFTRDSCIVCDGS
jgi:hypothetical protein